MNTNEAIKEAKVQLNGISHYALNVANMDRAEKFYTQVLGFPVIMRSQTKSGLKHFEIDAGNVAIALFEQPHLDLKPAHKIMTDDGFLHFAFEGFFERYDETLQALKDSGVELDGEPRDRGKSIAIYFQDPDGHQIEINFKK
jgi:catechol 2,3-dioxygenase-like lactoylglutathione lyase family enzyme